MATDYIADTLHAIRSLRVPRKAPKFQASSLRITAEEMREKARDLDGRELYAFDLSALNAASDLRIDTPDRVDRLVSAVLQEPRRLFIEARASDMGVINRNLRGVLSPFKSVDDPRVRWGASVDILGEGRARYQHCTFVPAEAIRTNPELDGLRREARSFEGRLRELVPAILQVRFSPAIADMDIARHVGMSRAEFDRAFDRIAAGSDPIAAHARKLLDAETGTRRRAQIMDETWRAVRFRDIVRTQQAGASAHEGAGFEAPDMTALRNGLPIIAMLAVLAADSSDLRAEPRQRESRQSGGGRTRKSSEMAPGLRVVTLNLEDRDMQRLYDRPDGAAIEAAPASSTGAGRVRHPVRGHLFLARNGRMTWRKPHWRGSLDRPVLRRVIAPSHKT